MRQPQVIPRHKLQSATFSYLSQIGKIILLATFLLTPSAVGGEDIVIHVQSASSLNFSSNQSSIDLSFSDFKSGSTTPTESVTYSVTANDITRINDVVLARLDLAFEGIDFQGKFGSYTKAGGDAHLEAATSGFVNLDTTDVGLADKVVDQTPGTILDGTFTLEYRATIVSPQSAGQQVRALTVSLVDK